MANAQADLLRGLSDEETAQLTALGKPVALAAGQKLFRLGHDADRIYLVLSGRIALTLPIQIRKGEEAVLVEEAMPGQTVGWSGLAPPHRFTLNATAAVATELLELPRAALLDHFAAQPKVGHVVTRNLAAVIGHRLQVFQTMWAREMQRMVESRYA
jgi:CRP/FNR family cyclic AMP-dependent transcriptional regulator